MDYTPRIIEKKITSHFNKATPPYHCVLLGGARQTGKSTLLTHLFPIEKNLHINLALQSAFCDAMDQTKNFAEFTFLLETRFGFKTGSERVLIIDEAQLSSQLGGYVRFMKEKWQNQKVILTGSTLSHLFDKHNKPTGRVLEFVLRPFNFVEFLSALHQEKLLEALQNWSIEKTLDPLVHQEMINTLQIYLKVGGLPEVVTTHCNGGDYLQLLANIFAFYKRDFSDKLSDSLTAIFNQVFLRIAAATGAPINLSSIIASSSPGYRKLQDVLAILEQWHHIIRVDCETSKLSKIGTLTPKRYIFDHGIRFLQNPARFSHLDLLDTNDVKRQEVGGIIENFVLTELLSLNLDMPLRSWSKTHQSGFIDFILSWGTNKYAIEVKAALHFNSKYMGPLATYKSFAQESILVITSLDHGGIYKKDNHTIYSVPVYALTTFLQKNLLN